MLKAGENTLSVEVEDDLDTELAYGKQKKKRGGMWYTPISGIWQAVWLEGVPNKAISSLRIKADTFGVEIKTEGGEEKKHISLQLPLNTLHSLSPDILCQRK